jgi:hypothetical protein
MKKATAILFVSLLGLALSMLALFLGRAASAQASAGVLYVAPHASCGGGVPNCYASVQAAVDAAAPADEIHVAAGVYTDTHVRPRNATTTDPVTQTIYLSKTVTIRGGYSVDFSARDPDTYATILDAQGQGRVVYATGNINPTIEGVRITGGDATGLGGYEYYGTYDAGGGVYAITATLSLNDSQVYSNTSSYGGGGVFLGNSRGRLDGNQIFDNYAQSGGGGVFLYQGSATLEDNSVISNTTDNLGGGLYLFSTSARLMGNTIRGNSASSLGGGLDVASCSPTLDSNVFSGNTAGRGGGIYLWYSHSLLTNNVIADNQASVTGSGIWIGGSEPRLLHSTIARNTGGDGSGVTVTDAGTTHTTLVMTNTLLASHSVGITVTAGSTADLNGVLWFATPVTVSQVAATVDVRHPYTGDPAFGADGYHLTSGSAAIDRGLPAGVSTDIDGQPRSATAPDLGADEYWPAGSPWYIYLPITER